LSLAIPITHKEYYIKRTHPTVTSRVPNDTSKPKT